MEHHNQTIPTTDILVRGDSGFATPDVYDLCDLYENQSVIRLKANRNLYRLAEEFVFYDNHHPWDEKESEKQIDEGINKEEIKKDEKKKWW